MHVWYLPGSEASDGRGGTNLDPSSLTLTPARSKKHAMQIQPRASTADGSCLIPRNCPSHARRSRTIANVPPRDLDAQSRTRSPRDPSACCPTTRTESSSTPLTRGQHRLEEESKEERNERCSPDVASKDVYQALQAHAHPQNRHLPRKVLDRLTRNARICRRVPGAGRDDERVEPQEGKCYSGNGVVADHRHVCPEEAERLVDVPGKRVEVVDQKHV